MWLSRSFLLVLLIPSCFCSDSDEITLSATVEFLDLSPIVSTTCDLPRQLKVGIKTEYKTLSLTLTRSKGVDENAPVYVMRKDSDGKLSYIKENIGKKDVVLYQADSNEAEFEVTCHRTGKSTTALVLDGTLELFSGKLFSLKKSETPNLYTLKEETLDDSFPETDDNDDDEDDPSNDRYVRSVGERIRRAVTTDVFIDVIALVEYSVYQRWYSRSTETTDALKRSETLDGLSRHFAHIFNAVNLRYKTASDKIHVNLAGIVIEDNGSGDWFESVRSQESDPSMVDAGKLLDTSDALRKSPGFPAHDHLVSFTSVNLYRLNNGAVQTSLAGLAYVGQICKANGKSVSTLEYHDVFAVEVRRTAHEIAHCLSARHDGSNGNTCDSSANYIMSSSPKTFTSTNPFTFSTCSADQFETHINSLLDGGSTYSSTCLLESLQAIAVPDVTNDELPGQKYDANEQCRMANGADSYHCSSFDISDTTICLKMWCRKAGTSSCTLRYAARGTPCGTNMWCDGLECVPQPTTTTSGTTITTTSTPSTATSTSTTMSISTTASTTTVTPTSAITDSTTSTTQSTTITTTTLSPSTSTTTTTASTSATTSYPTTSTSPTTDTTTASTTTTSDTTITTTTTTTTSPTTTSSAQSCSVAPSIPNADVTVTDNTATYRCKEGFATKGGTNSVSTCEDDVWSSTDLQCIDVSTCYITNGRTRVYSGTLSTTNGGYTCQAWDSQTPNRHVVKDSHFTIAAGDDPTPTKAESSNYCRDPYGGGRLWCVTTSPLKRWDYCDNVPACNTTVPSCPEPPSVPNADVTIADTKATFKCKEGFATQSGISSVSTCTNGVWSDVGLQCVDVSNCYVTSGRTRVYSGTLSTTNGGYTCQAWDSQTPNAHAVKDSHFTIAAGDDPTPTKAESSNYCRDPYGGGRLWCITTDPAKRWDYCDNVTPC